MHHRLRIVVVLLVAFILASAGLELAIRATPLPGKIADPPPATPGLLDARGRIFSVVATDFARDDQPLPLREMGRWLPLVTVGIEDHRFWSHGGIDFHALVGAAWRNVCNGRIISGASTITQQLVKNVSERKTRTMAAKVYEAFAAARLERTSTKKRILEAYLNRLDYGNRRIGPEAAAWAYFGKSAAELSLPEAIFLAGLPQSPARLNPWKNPAGATRRYLRNVRRLSELGLLPDGANVAMLERVPPVVTRHDPPNEALQFASMVGRSQMPSATTLQTTLDLDLQRKVERLLQEHLATLVSCGVNDAAVVVLENATGNVRALACAGDRAHAAINAAVTPRSCGSTLKPFLYLAAIDQRGLTAASLLPDTPDAVTAKYKDYDPQNYSNRFYGPVRLREALGNSMNVPAVVTLSKLGARETFEKLRDWGLNFPQRFDDYGAGFVLGNAQVRLLDLAGAYAGLARGGVSWKPKLTPADAIESRPMASPEACAIITDILCDNRARLLSFGNASPLRLEQRTAVKTGTSSGFRDGWCVGFNGRHTVAVWTGNLSGRSMGEMLAVQSAAPLWAAIMQSLYGEGDPPVAEPVKSANLRPMFVAAETGLLPRADEESVREWFLSGTEPKVSAESCHVDGRLVLPQEYASWCASPHNRLGAVVKKNDLRILFPQDGAVFEFNPHLPKGQQVMPLQSTAENCEWFLNGRKLAVPAVALKPGTWQLTATDSQQSARASYVVH
jgi:penicillin-binding protein 1C